MRVAALADVHANTVALEAVLAELAGERPDLIVWCGDLTWGALRRGVRHRRDAGGPPHMQYDRRVGELRLLDPGSVGLPYEPEPGYACWMVLGPDVELRRTPYDLEAALARMRSAGRPEFERIESCCASRRRTRR